MEKAMDEFYKDYHVTLHKELRKITDSLKEMMILVDQDKKLLEKSRKKRTIHADQMPELEEEREIIERLDKYTGQIELLVEAKGRIKAEIFERHKEAMLRGVMVKEDNESAERRKIKEEEELVVKMREDERLKKLEEAEKAKKEADERRLKKLQRSLSKSAANKLVKYRGKIDEEDDYANVKVPSFNKVSYKETMLKDIERRKNNTKTRAMTKSFGMKANHTDKLYKRNLKTHFEMEAVRMQVRKLREEDAMSRTTFKPQLNKRSLEIAETWEPHKVRAQESLEKARLDTIKKRALSYLESPKKHSVESKENKTSAAFKTKDLFCNHMYAKTMKWDEERRNLIENRRRQKEEEEYRELNKVPSSQRRRQNSPLRQVFPSLLSNIITSTMGAVSTKGSTTTRT
jgi:hypothetical protein